MPTHPIRYQDNTGHLHFLTWSCADRLPYLTERNAMETVEAILEQVRRDHGFQLLGYVFMPEHVHLLVSEPTHSKLSEAISVLKGLTSRSSTETELASGFRGITTSTSSPRRNA